MSFALLSAWLRVKANARSVVAATIVRPPSAAPPAPVRATAFSLPASIWVLAKSANALNVALYPLMSSATDVSC